MKPVTAAAILAGGDGRRLGGTQKALVSVNGRRLFDHVYASLKDHVTPIALCVRSPAPWVDSLGAENLGLAVLEDRPAPDRGPLGGIAAALIWASSLAPKIDWVLTVPVDVPFLPCDLVDRLTAVDADAAVAKSGDHVHHTIAAWRPALAEGLISEISEHAVPIRRFQSMVHTIEVEWAVAGVDPFLNINTPEDLELAERLYSRWSNAHRDALGVETE